MTRIIFIVFLSICFYGFSQNKTTYTYAIKGMDTLKMDVYKPDNLKRRDRLPTVLWMHGGGFAGGKRDNLDEVKFMEYLVSKNFVGISISYRLLRKGEETGFGCNCPIKDKLETFKQASIDYLDASKFVVENDRKLNVDVSKIIAGGSSAGAEGVLNAVYMKPFFVDELDKYEDINFAGVFSLAGALVNAEYINEDNAIPTAMFHGTEDNLVPYSSDPHHFCKPNQPGYLLLDGSGTIAEKLETLNKPFYLNKVIGGRHEWSSIPFADLDDVMIFFNVTINNSEIIQTKKIVIK